jgi:shikimate kinase
MHIWLIGFMGAGKTTLGREAARLLGLPFTDLDDRIVAAAGKPIREMFETEGEAAFRSLERQCLVALAGESVPHVVACGGGTPCFGDNMALIRANGLSIYLSAPPAVLAARLAPHRHTRPVLQAMSAETLEEGIRALLETRIPYYAQATLVFDTSTGSAGDLARVIMQHRAQI